ncbi:MAG: LuxR C-terminal-related transcriptional regulator [Myxococcaceae bacterium]
MEFLKENPIDLAKIIGPEFYRNRILEADPIYQERKKFLTALGIRQELELSTTDIDTIRLLLKGYSASQIAKLLYRSKRTIEHRIENIKLKWNCCSKAELIQKAQKLSNEGALSYNTF